MHRFLYFYLLNPKHKGLSININNTLETLIEVKNLNFYYKDRLALKNVHLSIKKAKITAILGPNGSGKSTLLKLMARLLKVPKGTIFLHNKSLNLIQNKTLAKHLSILVQEPSAPLELDVFSLVKAGRYPHQGFFQNYSKNDEAIINKALKTTDLLALKYNKLATLSGGQRQRAFIAMILAQNSPTLLFDEPTNHLDIKHQLEILKLLKSLNQQEQKSIILVLHDINLALHFADELLIFKDGMLKRSGTPQAIINEDLILEIFGVKAKVIQNKDSKKPFVHFF